VARPARQNISRLRNSKSYLMRIWLAAMERDHRLFDGRILTMVSPEVESYAPCGTPCGAESGPPSAVGKAERSEVALANADQNLEIQTGSSGEVLAKAVFSNQSCRGTQP